MSSSSGPLDASARAASSSATRASKARSSLHSSASSSVRRRTVRSRVRAAPPTPHDSPPHLRPNLGHVHRRESLFRLQLALHWLPVRTNVLSRLIRSPLPRIQHRHSRHQIHRRRRYRRHYHARNWVREPPRDQSPRHSAYFACRPAHIPTCSTGSPDVHGGEDVTRHLRFNLGERCRNWI